MKYIIFQVKGKLTRDYGFMGLSTMKSLDVKVDLDNYDLIYEGKVKTDVSNILEELYRAFNIEQPEDFFGRSMSVSDIVQIGDDYFYCDSIGWANINKQIKGK